jgi:DNA-binding MarR family transcriptional regulator
MITAFRPAPVRARLAALDVGLLTLADRACLRLLHRCETATGTQLGTLIYSSRRTALRHLRQLWRLGLVERTPLPPHRGGVPVAYRLTVRGSRRLGYMNRRQGGIVHIRHALDTVDVVCALSPTGAVQAWLTPFMTDDLFDGSLRPDAVLVLQADAGSAVVALEVDEATEHAPQILAKLDAYARFLPRRSGWHVLFVVPNADRLDWLRRVARWEDRPRLGGLAWGVTLADLHERALDAPVAKVGHDGPSALLRLIQTDPQPRSCPVPVGSAAWVQMLGSGGAEDVDEVLGW